MGADEAILTSRPTPTTPTTTISTSDRHIVAVLAAVAFVLFAFAARLRLGIAGDEPHYLAITQALLKYHTVDPTAVSTNGDYSAYYPAGALDQPHVYPAADGRLIPLHQFGGPLLWALPFLLWGVAGVHLLQIACGVAIVVNIYYLQRDLGITRAYAATVTALFTIGTPLYVYAPMLFIEPIGALVVIYAVRVILSPRPHLGRLTIASAGLGYLPWVHGRFAIFTLVLGALLAARIVLWAGRGDLRPYVCGLAPLVLLAGAIEVFNLVAYGTGNPAPGVAAIGGGLLQIPAHAGVTYLLLDGRFGLLPLFPVLILVAPGVLLCARREFIGVHVVLGAAVLPYLLAVSTFSTWWAGWSPPARFLSVTTPLLAFYVAVVLQRVHHWLLTSLAVIAAAVSMTVSVISDVSWADRFADVTDVAYQPWVRLGRLLDVDITAALPITTRDGVGGHLWVFAAWGLCLCSGTLLLWWLGARAPIERAPVGATVPFGRLLRMWSRRGG